MRADLLKHDTDLRLNFEVQDQGPGISAEQLKALFKPFAQADSSTTRKFGGTGLGLAICKDLIELMQGEISVTSEVNEGSCFRFSIPMSQGNSEREHLDSKTSVDLADLSQYKVLLVEDNIINIEIALGLLEEFGIQTEVAENGIEAIECISNAQQPYDLILMDCQMPKMDGYETTQNIRSELTLDKIPIIAMTANAMKGDKEKCLRAGMNDYLSLSLIHI